jgi:hypothetical protein
LNPEANRNVILRIPLVEEAMKTTLIALAAAATVAGAAITAPSPANATCWGCYVGGGVIAGLVGGALIAGAAQPYGAYYGYGPSHYYAPAPAYYGPGPGCYWANQRFWDGYAWRFQRVQVCN